MINEELVWELEKLGFVILTSGEFYKTYSNFGLHFGMEIRFWELEAFNYVWTASPQDLKRVPPELLSDIRKEQLQLSRGYFYSESWLQKHGQAEVLTHTDIDTIDNDGEKWLVLTYEGWHSLQHAVQESLMQALIWERLAEQPSSLHHELLPDLPSHLEALVMRYANRFADSSGANCFAATLAFASGRIDHAQSIIDLWLHESPFRRGLATLGYGVTATFEDKSQVTDNQTLDVLVWEDKQGIGQHAAFCLTQDYVLNKMGQSWVQPWSIVSFDDVADYNGILSSEGRIVVHRKF
ncbi:hypothetical protein [Paenibacillus herberti]|uniref:hypothetical protein n=1 Tax=Paenibacillus herberti TaxID=1619309 RepID=UPI0011320E2F|nr:hypothetical protein [Paenibacillus herberti]